MHIAVTPFPERQRSHSSHAAIDLEHLDNQSPLNRLYTKTMSEFQTITVRLSAEECDRLESEASRLRLTPDVLATKLLGERLAQVPNSLAALDALSQLRNIARQMPMIDAVKLARESRENLEPRGEF
jgi:hypothetical protein